MQRYKFSYDQENDDLFLYSPKSKSKGSVEMGDIILDFNTRGEFVGIQIMNACNLLKELVDEDVKTIKGVLGSLMDCKIETRCRNRLLFIKIYLYSKVKDLSPVIPVVDIKASSPAIARR